MRRVLLLPLVVAAFLLVVPGAAQADTTPATPTPTTSEATPSGPPTEGSYISVRLLDSSKPGPDGSGEPIPGVTLGVTTESKEEVGSSVSNDDGFAWIPIPGPGQYVVTLDEDTLPDGVELNDAAKNTRDVNALLEGSTNVQFQIGVQAVDTVSFGAKLADATAAGIKIGLIIALAALGLSLIFGTTGLTNFSHGELITLGAILTYAFNRGVGLPVIWAGLVAVILSAAFGWGQDRGLWRPLRSRGTGLIAMMIVSIGFGLFLRSVFQYVFGGSTKTLSQYVNQAGLDLGPISLAPKELWIMAVALVVIAVTCVALARTRLGKAMRAVSDNPALSASSGMRVDGVISSVWILGTALTGLSGVLLAINSQVSFIAGFQMLLLVFAAVTLGGLGTIWGALIGSIIIGLVQEIGPLLGVPSSIKEVGPLVVLILILLVRPQGILGRKQRIG